MRWTKALDHPQLEQGQLGEQAATLGSLFLTMIKNALFSVRVAPVQRVLR